MIGSLTLAQKARFADFVAEWTKFGLRTDTADRPTAEQGVADAYRAAGIAPPEASMSVGGE